MESKIIFLDIDGTLTNHEGYVPISARNACIKARENGHQIILCTGRSKAEIFDFIMEIGFDGIIGAGGGFVEYKNEMLYHKKVSEPDVRHMVDFFTSHHIDFYLESNGGLYASKNLIARLEQIMYGDVLNDPLAKIKKNEAPNPFITSMIQNAPSLYLNDVNKVCFLENPDISFDMIEKEFGNSFQVMQCTVPVFGKNSGELVIPNIHKAVAIEFLLKHLKLSSKNTVAIGDGNNDIEMFQYCNKNIAMGNATEELKALADYVTSDVDDDGLYNGFKAADVL